MKRCKRKRCREMNPDDAMFCQYCGYKFGRTKKIVIWSAAIVLCFSLLLIGYLLYIEKTQEKELVRVQKHFSIPVPNNQITRKAVMRFLPDINNPSALNYYVIETDSERNWKLLAFEESYTNFAELGFIMRDKIRDNSIQPHNTAVLCEQKDEEFVKTLLLTGYHSSIKSVNLQNDLYLFAALIPEAYQLNGCLLDISRDKIIFQWKEGRETVQLGYAQTADENKIIVELSRIIDMIPADYTDFFFVTGDFFLALAKESDGFYVKSTDFVQLEIPDFYVQLKSDYYMSNGLKLYQGIIHVSQSKNYIFRKHACREIGYLLSN